MIPSNRRFKYQSANPLHANNTVCIRLRYLCFKYRIIIYCSLIVAVLFELHRNFIKESSIDRLFERRCIQKATHHQICSFTFGFIENFLIFIISTIAFIIFFPLYWRLRYLNQFKCCENNSISLSFLDPYIMSFPWLLSPIFLFHSVTSLLIHFCVFIQSTDETSLKSGCVLIRTLWSFLLWFFMDLFIWSEFSMFYLFEKGPNKIFEMILPYHFKKVKQILLPHLIYIDDLVELILQFEGNHIVWKLVDMKQNINLSLSESNLLKPFYYLTIITVIMSSIRLLLSPEAVGVLIPILIAVGIIVVIIALILILMLFLSILTGGNVDNCNCNGVDCADCYTAMKTKLCDKSLGCRICGGLIGGIVASAIWGWIIWKIMNKKLKKMSKIQKQCTNLKFDDLYGMELYVGTHHRTNIN